MMRLHIVMLSVDYLPSIGGIASHIYNLAKQMVAMGHTVHVVRPFMAERFGRANDELSQYPGVPVKYAIYPGAGPRIRRIFARTRATLSVLGEIERNFGAINILHQHDYLVSSPAAMINGLHTKWIWTNHTSNFLRDYSKVIRKYVVRTAYSRTRGIIAVSRELEEATASLFPGKLVRYIPNGVDVERFSANIPVDRSVWGFEEGDFVVLCPRRMVPKNGVIYLAEAVKVVKQIAPDAPIKFAFLGNEPADNTDAAYIEQVMRALRPFLGSSVRLLGNVPPSEMPKVYAMADVVVLPSLVEAVSLSALEALASAKAVIATSVGGLPEVIHHERTGLLVPPRSPVDLAESIVRLYKDKALRVRIGVNGMQLVRDRYSWHKIAGKTVEFYMQVLGLG